LAKFKKRGRYLHKNFIAIAKKRSRLEVLQRILGLSRELFEQIVREKVADDFSPETFEAKDDFLINTSAARSKSPDLSPGDTN